MPSVWANSQTAVIFIVRASFLLVNILGSPKTMLELGTVMAESHYKQSRLSQCLHRKSIGLSYEGTTAC